MYDRNQYTQQHPDQQSGMQYHNLSNYTEDHENKDASSNHSALWEPPPYQESSYQNYPTGQNHYQDQMYHHNFWEQEQQQHNAWKQEEQQHNVWKQEQQPHNVWKQEQQQHDVWKQEQQQHNVWKQEEEQQQHNVWKQEQQQYDVWEQQEQQQHNVWEQQQALNIQSQPADLPQATTPVKKKRGRPSKADKGVVPGEKEEEDEAEAAKKAKRILNRFNGMSVDEVMAKTLPDVITHSLDILIIGINPGLMSAYKGHHYPNPGNHFWKCIFLSGLTDQQLNYMHDHILPEKYGIGFTNMVERTTPGSKDLSNKEIREGGKQLLEKLQKYKPLIAAFNGKGIYEIFCKETFGVKAKNLEFGLQPYKIPETETVCFLMPSSSPRCAQFPRAQDKVHFYIKLKELRDQIKGFAPSREVTETNYSFDLQLAKEDAKRMAIKEEQVDPEYESCSGLHGDMRPSSDIDNSGTGSWMT